MRIFLGVLVLLFIVSCSDQTANDNKVINDAGNSIDDNLNQDSIDLFSGIKGLEDIQFYIAGRDSVVVTNDLMDLNEMNGIRGIFHNRFAKLDSGLLKYETLDIARKYHVKRKKDEVKVNPSATIIQLAFSDKRKASAWYSVYDNSPEKETIQGKPKTELWLDDHYVYFIQTYHTPKRDYIDLIKQTLIGKMQE